MEPKTFVLPPDMPIAVNHRTYPASRASEDEILFDVECPTNQLLDSEVFVRYTLALPAAVFGAQLDGFADGGLAAAELHRFRGPAVDRIDLTVAPQQAAFVGAAASTITVRINGEEVVQRPGDFAAPCTRFYARPREIDSVCSMSGGSLDSGDHSHNTRDMRHLYEGALLDPAAPVRTASWVIGYEQPSQMVQHAAAGAAAAWVDRPINLASEFPVTDETLNPGRADRFERLAARLRSNQPANALRGWNHVGAPLLLVVTERIPVSPFLMWEMRDSTRWIPNLRKLSIRFAFGARAKFRMFVGRDVNDVLGTNTVDWWSTPPQLLCRWVVPKARPAPTVRIPWTFYRTSVSEPFEVAIAAADHTSESVDVVCKVRISNLPRRFFVFAQPTGLDFLSVAAEHFLELQTLEVQADGFPGKVRAEPEQLFAMYLRNSPVSHERAFDYDKWRRFYCVAVLTPEDVALPTAKQLDIDVRATVRSHWTVPSMYHRQVDVLDINRSYALSVVCEYSWGCDVTHNLARLRRDT